MDPKAVGRDHGIVAVISGHDQKADPVVQIGLADDFIDADDAAGLEERGVGGESQPGVAVKPEQLAGKIVAAHAGPFAAHAAVAPLGVKSINPLTLGIHPDRGIGPAHLGE